MKSEIEVYADYIKGKLDKYSVRKEQTSILSIENATSKEVQMKYKNITIHKNTKCNTWYTRFRRNNKQFYISAKTQRECYNLLKKALEKEKTNTQSLTYTLIQWYNKWLELYKLGKVKPNTIRNYKTLLIHIPSEIQNTNLNEIKLEQIINILNNCQAERQRQNLYELLNTLFQKAMDNEIIDKNLVKRIDRPKHEKTHSQALDNHQQEMFIEICNTLPNGDLLLVGLYQGLRRGEILGLTIDNIDFENDTLTINKGWNRQNQFDTTKNKQSIRTMPLFEQTKKILIKYKNKTNRIFELSNSQYENLIKIVKDKSQIENFKYKDMRATFITRCKELNIPKHIIQAWCGHKIGSSVTDTVYTRHNTDIDYKYINILNDTKFYSNSTHEKK